MTSIKKKIFTSFISFLLAGLVTQAQDSVAHRIILVGDAGKQAGEVQPELELIKKLFTLDKKTTVIFLGDNIYPQGLPSIYASNYLEKKQILDSQVNIVQGTEARAFVMAGNHDWMQGRPGGWQQVLNQYRYINSLGRDNVIYTPADVCPGPEEIPLSNKITLVTIDSQWWLHRFEKPGVTYGCDIQTEDDLIEELQDIVDRNEDKLLIFASHHPFITYGRHGGYFSIKQHVFPFTDINPKLYIPLPVLGSIYPISRGVFGDIQDVKHPINRHFTSTIDSILKEHPYCIRVSGHEHNLQFIKRDDQFYVVSGSGSKTTDITQGEDLVFGSAQTGFGVIDVIKNGNVRMQFYSTMNDTAEIPIFNMTLPALDTTMPKQKVYEVKKFPDSATAIGNPHLTANNFKRKFFGNNYREEWTTPVKVPVFDMGKEKGGLKITKKGGGMQTKSLRLEDAKGNEYVLRSVRKYPDNVIPEEFRETFIKDAVIDGISASYPFAALSIPALANAAGVLQARPRLVYIPDDPRLGYYHDEFANTLAIFEEREPGGFEKNSSTSKVLEKLQDDHDNSIDQQSLLRARMLDMFIMDFDRHEDQWRWATNDTGEEKTYYPIPRDRDQAFFVNEGFIPKQVAKPYRIPKFQGFRPKAININTFNFNARFFDRTFLSGLERDDWDKMADSLLRDMTDSVIYKALAQQPKEIYKFSAPDIIKTLQERRKYFKEEMLEYYTFLAKEVDITASDKREFIDVVREDNGDVEVTICKINKEGEVKRELYKRKFLNNETKEIRLYARGGEDSIRISGNGGPIKVRIIGGAEKDHIINNSTAGKNKTLLYDFIPDKNIVEGKGKAVDKFSNSPYVNRYNRRAFSYDILHPSLAVAYNRDDGIYLGLAARYTAHGFRKEPYKMSAQVSAHHALATKAFMYRFNLEFIDALGDQDLLVNGDLRLPRNTINFFGFGNETEYDNNNGIDINYYRTRYDHASLNMLLRTNVNYNVSVSYGPSLKYFYYSNKYNRGKILEDRRFEGLDTNNLSNTKTYIGPMMGIVVDNRNSSAIPSRGVLWTTDLEHNVGLSSTSRNYTRLNSDLRVYISSNRPAKLVIGLRFGGGYTWGDYEYYQAQYLSGTQNLRGYRKFRFAGDKMFYNNVDVRYKIGNLRTYLLPGSYGLLAFHDIGRVWYKNENSNAWHNGYGGGVWIAPANKIVATAYYAFSKDGGLPAISIGYQF